MDPSFSGKDSTGGFKLFDHGRLLPLSDLLMLNRQELLTDARILLPFWYTIPVVSSILAFFFRPKRQLKQKKTVKKTVSQTEEQPNMSPREAKEKRKQDLKQAVVQIQKKLIPEGTTLEAEISVQLESWNRTLDKQTKENLTEDVNSLIRDYIRRIIRTIKASTFDLARVENLALTLVNTPNLVKIKNHDALLYYIKLYILQLIANIS